MSTQQKPDWQTRFEADRPIFGREFDRLDRKDFADTLASAVQGWKGRDSLVIALHGAWGSGKTSVKNMVVESLRSGNTGIVVADFNPWQFASRNHIAEAFFDQIGIALGKGTVGSGAHRKRLLGKWRRYAAYLKAGGNLTISAKKMMVITLLVLGLFFGTAYIRPTFALVFIGIALLGAGLLASSGFVQGLSDLLAVGTDVGRRSLEEVKEDLASEIRQLASPVLVIMDDIDRLVPAEAVEVFQLVKANADLPNLVYLMLFQRDITKQNI